MNKPNCYLKTVTWRRNRILGIFITENKEEIIEKMLVFSLEYQYTKQTRKDLERLIRVISGVIWVW